MATSNELYKAIPRSYEKKKKIFTTVERELFIQENHSVGKKGDEVEPHSH